ncbi:MAG: glycosyltransferase family 4 protein [Caldilinea sp.]|nr:glycosyltransferase family 4 protein [Caldilinea sp.]
MRIVLPVHHFLPRYSAGAELYTYRLAKWLQVHGHEVEVIAIEEIDRGGASTIEAVRDVFEGIQVWRLSFNLLKAPQRRLWEFDNPLLGEWFETYFQRQRPDIAHFQAGYLLGVAPIFAAHSAGVPIVLTLHDYWFLCPQHTLQRSDGALCTTVPDDPAICARCRLWSSDPYARLARWGGTGVRPFMEKLPIGVDGALIEQRRKRVHAALALAARVIAPSQFMQRQFEHLVEPERLVFSRIGIDSASLQSSDERNREGGVKFGYVGQVAQHKGVHILVEAFRCMQSLHRDSELHIWGGLETQPEYVRRLRAIADGDARVHFHGRFENRYLSDVLRSLDFVVAPSLWYENCPLSILESFAANVPVICSDHGGMVELVNDGEDGLRFRPGDVADLARVMQQVVDDEALLIKLQQGARRHVVRDVNEEMRYLNELYAEIHAEAQVVVNNV